jgi:hypothetical protein
MPVKRKPKSHTFEKIMVIAANAGYLLTELFDNNDSGYQLSETRSGKEVGTFQTLIDVLEFLEIKR